MRQLSGLDASFLFLETPQMPMHVGALHVFEWPLGHIGNPLDAIRAHIANRLSLAPALCRKLAWMPLNLASPAWIDAVPDLSYHIVGVRLAPGSGIGELERQVGLLHPELLDRKRPLWKFYVFDGLERGPLGEQRFGLYTQLHHAAVDGQAAVALAQAILDTHPAGREVPADAPRLRHLKLGAADMLRIALAGQAEQLGNLVKALPSAVGTLSQVALKAAGEFAGDAVGSAVSRVRGKANSPAVRNVGLAPRTRWNVSVSEGRAFATVSLPLGDVNAVRKRHGASLNDAVLMVCSGALRRFLGKHGPLPRKSLIAAVPVSLRAKGDSASNNQASMSLMSLGTHVTDPQKRLAHIMEASASMKSAVGSVKRFLPTDFPSMGVPWLLSGLSAVYGRAGIADRIPVFANVVISNVPGPLVPLYMAGAKMLSNHPASIVVHGMALNITVQTYHDGLDFGLMACADAMPEVGELAAFIETAFMEFAALPPTSTAESLPASATPSSPKGKVPKGAPAAEGLEPSGRPPRVAKKPARKTVTASTQTKPATRASAPTKRRAAG